MQINKFLSEGFSVSNWVAHSTLSARLRVWTWSRHSSLIVMIKRKKHSLVSSSVVFLPPLLFLDLVFPKCHSAFWELCRAAGDFNAGFMDGCKSAIVVNSPMNRSPSVHLVLNVWDAETRQSGSNCSKSLILVDQTANILEQWILMYSRYCNQYHYKHIFSTAKRSRIQQSAWM